MFEILSVGEKLSSHLLELTKRFRNVRNGFTCKAEVLADKVCIFLLPSLPKISYPIEGTVTRTDVAFYFMPGAEQWYKYQSRLLWHPFNLMKLFGGLA
jgi:hypothetical protein